MLRLAGHVACATEGVVINARAVSFSWSRVERVCTSCLLTQGLEPSTPETLPGDKWVRGG